MRSNFDSQRELAKLEEEFLKEGAEEEADNLELDLQWEVLLA